MPRWRDATFSQTIFSPSEEMRLFYVEIKGIKKRVISTFVVVAATAKEDEGRQQGTWHIE